MRFKLLLLSLFSLFSSSFRAGERPAYDPDTFTPEPELRRQLLRSADTDVDRDGIANSRELDRLGTQPTMWDTDCDGISDAEDAEPLFPWMRRDYGTWTAFWHRTAAELGLTVPPLADFSDKKFDYDGDGLDNEEEFARGTSPLAAPGKARFFFSLTELVSEYRDVEIPEGALRLRYKERAPFYTETNLTVRVLSHDVLAGYFASTFPEGWLNVSSGEPQRLFNLSDLREGVLEFCVFRYGLPRTFLVSVPGSFRDNLQKGRLSFVPYGKSEKPQGVDVVPRSGKIEETQGRPQNEDRNGSSASE